MVFDFALVVLVCFKAAEDFRISYGSPFTGCRLMTVIARDSIYYFVWCVISYGYSFTPVTRPEQRFRDVSVQHARLEVVAPRLRRTRADVDLCRHIRSDNADDSQSTRGIPADLTAGIGAQRPAVDLGAAIQPRTQS